MGTGDIEPMDRQAARRRRPRSIVIALILAALVVAVYFATIYRFGEHLAGGAS